MCVGFLSDFVCFLFARFQERFLFAQRFLRTKTTVQYFATASSLTNSKNAALSAILAAHAATYPMAILGIIGTLLFLKIIFRIDASSEGEEFAPKSGIRHGVQQSSINRIFDASIT
jgi:uncharacterized transporter YbjL